ncbi:Kti12p [Sugiyamaella lignohabitans]|uniref:Kti12p n=1 Tax=Sugiyamaella lignohabitans TaxID=796027 RepID=A0A167EBI2_9ASCO|nr:Kti12p [Sugiyamaella lignohabitans]ANB13872.1 Kti12p [Sugiyamaella lignohabitans]
MPLITVSGLPSSGKTTRALQLKAGLERKIAEVNSDLTVYLINDESLSISKETYRELHSEKATRGAQISAVKRHLGKNTIVIFDNLSYIKGFRYQLFCEAKALSTNACLVHVGAPKDMCVAWNKSRPEGEAWPEDLFDALVFRYEEPNPMSRWDSPLFPIAHEDTEADIPIDEIWDTLVLRKPKPPNAATVLKPVTAGNYLTELDKITTSVVNEIIDLHKTSPGGLVKLDAYDPVVQLPMRLTVASLNRIRRNFVTINKMKPIEVSRIRPHFIEFAIKNLSADM